MKPKKHVLLLIILLIVNYLSFGQSFLEGKILDNKDKKMSLIGVSVRWVNSPDGGVTDPDGYFKIKKRPENHQLIISLIGYKSDTLMVHSSAEFVHYLTESTTDLASVSVIGNSSVIDRLNPIQTELITVKALKKAACCNLSESFETNASVSVSYADAITGAKQIQMLGLSGNYLQINTENIPNIRGLNTTFGLNYTPGTWIQSIDIGKGAGSVVNGYESMTGVINVELIKPENSDKLFINSYLNSQGRAELNVHLADTLSKKWAVGLLSHISSQLGKIDGNKDSFLDIPLFKQYNFINRWKYQSEKFATQFGIKFLNEKRIGGQKNFNEKTDKNTSNAYGFGSQTDRLEIFSKLAILFPDKPYIGLGLIINGLIHKNESYFGFKPYSGKENSLYSNLIFQNIVGNTNHTYKVGGSIIIDQFDENYLGNNLIRNETVPGLFGEYNFNIPEKLNILIGNRVDFHNIFGTSYTPRLHIKYDLNKKNQVRFNIGKGWRVPNQIAENFGFLVNSRTVVLNENIQPEISWNFGASINNEFDLFDKKGTVIVDYYKTDFKNQLVVDMENTSKILFYNQVGRSFSNTFQAEVNYSPKLRFDIKLAYRNVDIRNDVLSEFGVNTLLPKAFVNKDRLLLNLAYATKWNKWKYDFTWQWNGKRRIPNIQIGHIHNANTPQIFAPAFSNINAQVSKVYKNWEFYLGGENLNNFKQKEPIIGWQDPFGANFDASMVWGPVAGRMIYTGFRYKIEKISD